MIKIEISNVNNKKKGENCERGEQEETWIKNVGVDAYIDQKKRNLIYQNAKFNTRIKGYQINVEYEIRQAISKIYTDYKNNNYEYYWTIAERGYIIRSLNMYMNKWDDFKMRVKII